MFNYVNEQENNLGLYTTLQKNVSLSVFLIFFILFYTGNVNYHYGIKLFLFIKNGSPRIRGVGLYIFIGQSSSLGGKQKALCYLRCLVLNQMNANTKDLKQMKAKLFLSLRLKII